MTDPVALSSILGKFSEPRKPTVKYHHAELEAVVAMWKQRYASLDLPNGAT